MEEFLVNYLNANTWLPKRYDAPRNVSKYGEIGGDTSGTIQVEEKQENEQPAIVIVNKCLLLSRNGKTPHIPGGTTTVGTQYLRNPTCISQPHKHSIYMPLVYVACSSGRDTRTTFSR